MLAPMAPHITEELWQRLDHSTSLAWTQFPVVDEALLVDDTVEVPVQVNRKLRAVLTLPVRIRRRGVGGRARATHGCWPRWTAVRPAASSRCRVDSSTSWSERQMNPQ